jgi:hypothetical protein
MFNPWLSLPLQAVRFGWDAQSMMMEQMMRLTGMRSAEQKPPSAPAADMAAATEVAAAEASVVPAETASPGNSRQHRQAAQKAATIQKRGKSKHRRSK